MAEVEIHTGPGHSPDPFGQRVGIMVGLIGILLSVVTILAHREHTAVVVHQTEANDQWAFYQAKKIREHNAHIGATLLSALAADPAKVAAVSASMTQDSERYTKEAAELFNTATEAEKESRQAERRALRFDVGEGFLELGLVMSSLYFLSRKRFFVVFGGIGAVAGAAIGIIGWLS